MNAIRKLLVWGTILALVAQCHHKGAKENVVNIPGTPVKLIAPPGFSKDASIGGLKHNSLTAAILVVEIPKAFADAVLDLTKPALATQGLELITKEEINIHGLTGILCEMSLLSHGYNFRQWMLTIPFENSTISVNGTFLAQDENKISLLIKKALLSVELSEVASNTDLPFDVDAQPWELAKVMAGPSAVFTPSGEWSESSLLTKSLFVGRSTNPQADVREFSRYQFSEACHMCTVESEDTINIDGRNGIELWGYTSDRLKIKYQVVFQDTVNLYLIIGTAKEEHDGSLQYFKKVARSFSSTD